MSVEAAARRCTRSLDETAEAHHRAGALMAGDIASAAARMQGALAAGHKVLVCGNGGSAAESQHFAAELTGRFRRERRALAAVALSVDTSALTAIGNDYGFDQVFARQVEALGQAGDVLLAISTSGQSANVVQAARTAGRMGLVVVALTGASAGALGEHAAVVLAVPEDNTARVQEVQLSILHLLCEEIERALAGDA
jgi:D-sedoheptulose 7-phosphate isomerase